MSGIVVFNKILYETLPLETVVSKDMAHWITAIVDARGHYENKFFVFYRPAKEASA